jgi:hypothetical protein
MTEHEEAEKWRRLAERLKNLNKDLNSYTQWGAAVSAMDEEYNDLKRSIYARSYGNGRTRPSR